MLRLASILSVATLVMLSGCESSMKTDYAKELEGTWTGTTPGNLTIPDTGASVPATFTVTAEVTRTDTNKGSISQTIVGTPTGATASQPPIKVAGSFEIDATEITVSDIRVEPMTILEQSPTIAQLLTKDVTLTYKLADGGSKLTVGSEVLFPVLIGPTTTEITLTRQTGSDG